MSAHDLPVSTKRRDGEALEVIQFERIDSKDINIITLGNGNRIQLSAADISTVVSTISDIAKTGMEIWKIRETGRINVENIEAEIRKISATGEDERKSKEQDAKIKHGEFDKKHAELMEIFQWLQRNPGVSAKDIATIIAMQRDVYSHEKP